MRSGSYIAERLNAPELASAAPLSGVPSSRVGSSFVLCFDYSLPHAVGPGRYESDVVVAPPPNWGPGFLLARPDSPFRG